MAYQKPKPKKLPKMKITQPEERHAKSQKDKNEKEK